MPSRTTTAATRASKPLKHALGLEPWKLEDAKARFSELVRKTASGPQLVTIRGKEAAIVLAPDEYRRLLPKPKDHQPLIEFLQGLGLDEIDLTRDRDTGREIDL